MYSIESYKLPLAWGILLVVSLLGSRLQGISLSMLGGLGVGLLTLFCNATPAEPPFKVVLCIATILTAIGTIEAAGGIDYLIRLAESFIRKHPHRIVYISPMITYLITFVCGTNHVAYSILPVIAAVSKEVGIRPERALSLSVIAALHGALASPISSIMVVLCSMLHTSSIGMLTICKTLIPSTIGGLLLATWVTNQFSKTMPAAMPTPRQHQQTTHTTMPLHKPSHANTTAKLSIVFFLLGSLSIVAISSIPSLRPSWEVDGSKVSLAEDALLALIMLSTAGLMMLCLRIPPSLITQGKAFITGVQGMLSLLGIAWLSSTVIEDNKPILLQYIAHYLTAPWQFVIILLLMAAMMGSTAATIKAIFPLGIALGISPKVLLASAAAANGVFIMPIYPTMLAAIHLDTTGSTRIGKLVLNHSFMIPGLLSVTGAIAIGFLLMYIGAIN